MKTILKKIVVGVIIAISLNLGISAEASVSDTLFASRIEKKQEALISMQISREYFLKAISKPLISDERFRGRLENKIVTLVGAE